MAARLNASGNKRAEKGFCTCAVSPYFSLGSEILRQPNRPVRGKCWLLSTCSSRKWLWGHLKERTMRLGARVLLLNDSQLLCTLPSLHSLTPSEPAGDQGSPTAPSVLLRAVFGKAAERHRMKTRLVKAACVHVPRQQHTSWAAPVPPPPHSTTAEAAAHMPAAFLYLGCWGH